MMNRAPNATTSTLLKLMLGLMSPGRGAVRIDGQSVREGTACIGYVPQNVHTNRSFPMTALDVVLMGKRDPRKRCARKSAANRREALEALARLEMAG